MLTISIPALKRFPDDATDIDSLASNADAAMYTAKQSARNAYRFFEDKINTAAIRRLGIENGLRQALRPPTIRPEFQPKTLFG